MLEKDVILRKIKKRLRIISLYNDRPISEIDNKNMSWNIKDRNYHFINKGNLDAKITHKKNREGD
ncbi:MAG: hypothetical protein ACFE8A_10545 [Candidatus Hodarchaeota archaeon]